MNISVRKVPEESFTNTVTPQFLLRVGGLPITMLDTLNFERTTQWLDAVLLLESLLTAHKDKLVDALHEAVNIHKEDQVLRRKLINFKRNVFNMNLLGHQDDARQLLSILPSETTALLNEWLDLCERYWNTYSQGSDILAQESGQKRILFKKMINTPDFRKGILLASPILNEAIEAYIGSDNLKLSRKARTVEHSLLEYWFRMLCKTSPFSTFTSVSFGAFEQQQEASEQDVDLVTTSMEKQSFTRINMMLLSRLSMQILAAPDIKWSIPVRLTTGWRILKGKVKYIRRKTHSEEDDEDGSLAKVLDIVQENIIQLPVGSLLREIIELMEDGHEERLDALVAHLCAQDRSGRSEEEIKRYLQHLLRLSFLIIPAFQLDIHSARPLAAYRNNLYAIKIPRLNQLADSLGEVEALVDAYASASFSARREMFPVIKEKVRHCYRILGQSEASISLPKTILYEDTIIKPQRLRMHTANLQPLLDQASELQSLLPIFDIKLQDKLMMRGYFQGRYGAGQRCDDFLAFADTYNQDFLHVQKQGLMRTTKGGNEAKALENPFNLPEVDKLNDARQEVTRYIDQTSAHLLPDARELILGDDFFAAIASHVPQNIGAIQSNAFFAQLANIGHEQLLIVNQIYSGLTLMFSRFAYCFANEADTSIVTQLRATLKQTQPPGTVFAELKGGYEATNLNLHPAVTPYELVCPGEISGRPIDEQIPLEDLFIQHDAKTGQLHLFSKRLGKEVVPLYLGFLMPLALPEIQQILLHFSYLTMCPLDLWSGTERDDQTEQQKYYPRLRYKNIVLQRAMWCLHPTQIPQRQADQTDADFFLSVTRWRKELRLPAKVFISPDRSQPIDSSTEVEKDGAAKKSGPSYKPLYVDFENYFSVMLLEAATRKTTKGLKITEMLPERDHLWFNHDEQAYVSEFVIEMNHIKGERHV